MPHRHKSTLDSHFDAASQGVQYGLLLGRVVRFGTEEGTPIPLSQIIVEDDVPQIWRVAVNVRSDDGSNDQAIVVDPLEGHPIVTKLDSVSIGYSPLPDPVPGLGLDYVREPLFDPSDLETLPPFVSNKPGLEDLLKTLTQQAQDGAAAGVHINVWGTRFDVGDRPVAANTTYGDKVGIHDVHMNQGNPPRTPKTTAHTRTAGSSCSSLTGSSGCS